MQIDKDQVISLKGKHIGIQCTSGALWVTWPRGRETTLKTGQSVTVACKGKICIMGLASSSVCIQPIETVSKAFQHKFSALLHGSAIFKLFNLI